MRIVLLTLILMMGCSNVPRKGLVLYRHVDARTIEYVKEFEKHYGKNIPNITIEFRDLPGNAKGLCNTITRKIYIDEDKWYGIGKLSQEELIFHELGHCVLGLGHDFTIKSRDFCPTSMMYKDGAIVEGCYEKDRDYFIKELFFRDKNRKSRYKWKNRDLRKYIKEAKKIQNQTERTIHEKFKWIYIR